MNRKVRCADCQFALMRSETEKHYNYEACEAGVLPMMPNLPEEPHNCRMWKQGKPKEHQEIIFLSEIDVFS